MWYGKHLYLDPVKVLKRRKLTFNKKIKKISLQRGLRNSLNLSKTYFSVPGGWEMVLLESNNTKPNNLLLYLYNKYYYFKIAINNSYRTLGFDPNSTTFNYSNFFSSNFKSFYHRMLKNIFKSFSASFFIRLKIRGKGYYVYKSSRNTVTHQLGHSHRTYIYSFYVFVKFFSKTIFFLFGSSKTDLFKIGRRIRKSKYINIFTGRGIRFSRQIIYKKTGKVSSYR